MDILPLDVLACVFMFVSPQQLYNGDIACVCKRWLAALKALPLHRERWRAYAIGAILPRIVRPIHNHVRIDFDNDGNVMSLEARRVARVDGGWHIPLPLHSFCPHALECETFSVLGNMVYFRACIQTYVYHRRRMSRLNLQNVTAIRTYADRVWILCNTGIHVLQYTKVLKTVPFDGALDFAVIGDTIYIATTEGVYMINDGKRTTLHDFHGVKLHVHNGELYGYDTNVYIRAANGTTRIRQVDKKIQSMACIGTSMFLAVKDAIEVWLAKGKPTSISVPGVKRLVATHKKLYALSNIISIYF